MRDNCLFFIVKIMHVRLVVRSLGGPLKVGHFVDFLGLWSLEVGKMD